MPITPEIRRQITDAAAKMHKCFTGRGPENLRVDVTKNVITISFYRFLTPIERCVLRNPENERTVMDLRNALARCLTQDWQAIFAPYGLDVVGIEGDIDFEQEKRVIRITVDKLPGAR